MAALKVLAAAYAQTGSAAQVALGSRILMDVEETEAILAGYWEGVLDETRWELAEQRRAAGGVGEQEKRWHRKRRRKVRLPSGNSRNARRSNRRKRPRHL